MTPEDIDRYTPEFVRAKRLRTDPVAVAEEEKRLLKNLAEQSRKVGEEFRSRLGRRRKP